MKPRTQKQTNWKRQQLQKARHRAKLSRANQPKKPVKALTSKADFVKALKGTGGIKTRIAENMGINRNTVDALLARPDWTDVLQEYEAEREAGVDAAEQCIMEAISQRLDIGTASMNARWLLSKLRRHSFGDDKTLTIDGGPNPIRTQNVNIDINALNLPIDVKRQILTALDDEEDKQKRKLIEAQVVPTPTAPSKARK
jgi:DNA-binding CsgD family transcriptional regulator